MGFTDTSWGSFSSHMDKRLDFRVREAGIGDGNGNGDTRQGDWPRLRVAIAKATADTYQPNHSADRASYHGPCPHGKPYIPQLPIASHFTLHHPPQRSWGDFYNHLDKRLDVRVKEAGIGDGNGNGDTREGDWPRLRRAIAKAFADCFGKAHQDDRATYHGPHGGHSGGYRSKSWNDFQNHMFKDLIDRTAGEGIGDGNGNGDTRSGDWPRLARAIAKAAADVYGKNHQDNRATHHGPHGGH
jgi:hypothetical protein